MHFPCGGCNGCDIEVVAALTPLYDAERFGVLLKGTPRHADILLVTGVVTMQIKDRLKRVYEQVPDPKVVIAVGDCAISGCVFDGSYAVAGPVDKVIPVDVYIAGCPPKPEAILAGVVKALEKLP
ncbi:MAG: hydrogenase [Thermoprotei archaeon]|nr:MAG: hydrogenase [Thermoprotei archaeon]